MKTEVAMFTFLPYTKLRIGATTQSAQAGQRFRLEFETKPSVLDFYVLLAPGVEYMRHDSNRQALAQRPSRNYDNHDIPAVLHLGNHGIMALTAPCQS